MTTRIPRDLGRRLSHLEANANGNVPAPPLGDVDYAMALAADPTFGMHLEDGPDAPLHQYYDLMGWSWPSTPPSPLPVPRKRLPARSRAMARAPSAEAVGVGSDDVRSP